MFLKTGELKKMMKSSLKKAGLAVGNVRNHYLVYSDCWGVYIGHPYASNKFKAAIMELIGDLPAEGECYLYTMTPDKELSQESVFDYPDPFENWKEAKDYVAVTPLCLTAWPHEYMVCQQRSDLKYIVSRRAYTDAVISEHELESAIESMPVRPNVMNGVLYYKNETTIYWAHTEGPGRKAQEVLFPRLSGINFFEDDWLPKEPEGELSEDIEGEEELLPY